MTRGTSSRSASDSQNATDSLSTSTTETWTTSQSITATLSVSSSGTRIVVFSSASAAGLLLNLLANVGLYEQAPCLWPIGVVVALFICVVCVQGLYVAYRWLVLPDCSSVETQGAPLWRALLLAFPYGSALIPCHYHCALGHTLNAFLHFTVFALLIVILTAQLQGSAVSSASQLLLYFCASLIACAYQPLYHWAFAWTAVTSVRRVDSAEVLRQREMEELEKASRLQRRAARRRERALAKAASLEAPATKPPPPTIDDLYVMEDDECVAPFVCDEGDASDPWVTSDTFASPDFEDQTENFEDGTVFAVFEDLEDEAWQPTFVRRTEEECALRLQEALEVLDEAGRTDNEATNLKMERIVEACERMEEAVSESEDEPEPLAPMVLGNVALDFLEDPVAADVFNMFDDLDEGLAMRELHAPTEQAQEQAPARRTAPPLPPLPEPPRYLKYLNAASQPRSETRSETASVAEQSAAGLPDRTFLDDVLDDLESDEEHECNRNERLEHAIYMGQMEVEEEQQAAFEASQKAMELMDQQRLAEALGPFDTDPSITICDGVLLVETLTTHQGLATVCLAVLCLGAVAVLYALSSSGALGARFCDAQLQLPAALGIDVGVQVSMVALTWLYRYLQASDTQASLHCALHPFHGEERAETL